MGPKAAIVYDGDVFTPPVELRIPDGRLAGSAGDNLVELAGKVCYDTFSRPDGGRPSPEYHANIRKLRHHSVHAHLVDAFEIVGGAPALGSALLALQNRPGVWVTAADEDHLRFVASLRAVIEWAEHGLATDGTGTWGEAVDAAAAAVYAAVLDAMAARYPLSTTGLVAGPPRAPVGFSVRRDRAILDRESWVSLYLEGVSRDLCYRPDTEILAADGWKPITELQPGDVVLTKDPGTGLCRWSRNKATVCLDYSGPVHWFQNNEWASPAVTPDHIVWCGRYDRRRARGLSCRTLMDQFPEKVPYATVKGKRFAVDHAIRHDGATPETVTIGSSVYPTAELFEWLGWVCTDGGANRTRKRVYVTQTKQAGVTRVTQLMDRLFPGRWRALDYRATGGGWVGKIHDAAVWTYVVENFGRLKKHRRATCMFGYGADLIRHFLAGVAGGDGSVNRSADDHLVVHCSYPKLAGDYQVLYAMTGRSGCVHQHNIRTGDTVRTKGVNTTATMDALYVSVHKTDTSLVTARHQKETTYTGKVYCPQTTDGLVYVRRRGHGVWCGNCQELVRHHWQANPSVRSTRYVDEGYSAQVVPPALVGEDRQELFAAACAAYGAAKETYKKIFAGLKHRGVDEKTARGAARSVLPGATETKLVYSASVFQWKHILALRADEATGRVDPEIKRLAGLIRDALARYL